MATYTYEQITDAVAQTLAALTEESRGKLTEDDQTWWDMARGAIKAWEVLVGTDAKAADRERLEILLNDMPGYDDEGEGNWRETVVVRL